MDCFASLAMTASGDADQVMGIAALNPSYEL
jgi:hypothetical protein